MTIHHLLRVTLDEVQAPKVGSIVHYQAFRTTSGEPIPVARAAIVTEISSLAPASSMLVGLCVLNPDGLFFKPVVPYSETPKPGFWNWPPQD